MRPTYDADMFNRTFPPPHLYMKRCTELWLQGDGKIVLQAGSLGFRVEKDTLAQHSSVFRSILGNADDPSPAARAAFCGYREGCHYVVVEDTAEDMRELLSAMFIPDYFERFPPVADFGTIEAILRMSHRYRVAYLQRRALGHLAPFYPTRLVDFPSCEEPSGPAFINNGGLHTAVAIAAADAGATWILPTALYLAATACTRDELLDGVEWRSALRVLHERWRRPALTLMHELGWQYKAYACLVSLVAPPGCTQDDSLVCPGARTRHIAQRAWCADPLDARGFDSRWEALRGLLCESCFWRTHAEYGEYKRKVWDALPGLFGIELGWGKLNLLKTQQLAKLETARVDEPADKLASESEDVSASETETW
ncbi:hypothetical protein BD626DRAFT_633680 [Schizophyllum amplum]|uniref:BTB domain-containing protein n=1 Tax=Schizophyllum amplum TaxID=97359 RepID=A0A550C2B7_9AGAR|nr:hypothetical protein BD626DRAFT_633680 [Auriculariopsis ampla]